MNSELTGALERIGWFEVYSRYIPGLGNPSGKGECAAKSPFPDSTDVNPSFSVNIHNGFWRCFSSGRAGNFVQFRALMEATEFDEDGRAIPDHKEAERNTLVELGIASPVDNTWVLQCRDNLRGDLLLQQGLAKHKPWNPEVLYQLNIGFDYERNRFVIPIYDRQGKLVNCRMYRPGGEPPKMLWLAQHLGCNLVFPSVGYRETIVILVEGETDALSLRSFGFSAISGQMGKDGMVPEGFWWRNKDVYVWGDTDAGGREAADNAGLQLRDLAKSVRIIALPEWPGRPSKADVSDYIQYLLSEGFGFEGVQRAIVACLNASTLVPHPHSVFDQTARELSFADALSGENLGQRISFTARITGRSERRYLLPTVINIVCPADGHPYCKRCPMRTEFHGNARFTHDPRSRETLKLIQGTEREQMDAYKRMHGIALQCPDPVAVTAEVVNVESVMLTSSIVESEENIDRVERSRREALIIVEQGKSVEERDYILEGFVYPAPKTQHGLFLVDKFTPSVTSFENFKMTPEIQEQLQVFVPLWQQSVMDKLSHIADDQSDTVTLIKARRDLHLAYRTVFHSALTFNFSGRRVDRGWIEALVVGDTRCGKSIAFRRLSEFFGIGLLVDCKNQTPAGILGAVTTAQSSGERYVVPGLMPQQDGRVICFDEFHVPKWAGKQGLIDVLSSTRSEGVVRISKAASAQFPARVRSIWLANPGMGRLMSELGISGVEVIPRLIGQPEDIARFDFALTLSQTDVSVDLINSVSEPERPVYPRELCQKLLAWIYSRKPDQVVFTADATSAVMQTAIDMYNQYDPTIPLVEPADQRNRVAKVAVSVAAQCFSTNPTGEEIVVRPEHVAAARELFTMWYNKPTMGYDRYSVKIREQRQIRDVQEVYTLFKDTLAPHGKRLAEELLRLDQFTERSFGTIVPTQNVFARSVLQILYSNRCIKLVDHGRRENYELTSSFIAWLKWFVETQ